MGYGGLRPTWGVDAAPFRGAGHVVRAKADAGTGGQPLTHCQSPWEGRREGRDDEYGAGRGNGGDV